MWRQPGTHRSSGVQRGAAAVGAVIGRHDGDQRGGFALTVAAPLLVNGDTVAARIHFSAKRARDC